jgi:hypothetical protein
VIAAESASETETSRSVRDTGRRSESQTIRAAIKALFRSVVKAITAPAEGAPQPRVRRRRGETEGAFRKLAKAIVRQFDARKLRQRFRKRSKWLAGRRTRTIRLPPEAWGPEDAYLTNTLDLQRLWNSDAGMDGGDCNAGYDTHADRLSPRL